MLLLTTRPSPSNYDIIENDLKPNVRALLSEPVFTENSCLNRHLEGIRITFFMSQCVSMSLSVCKCAYMRGLAIWAPTQTISLFWKCSLKSSGVDRSQEQRGKWALASFLLSLRAFRLQSLCQTDIQLASKTVPEACRSLEKPRERGLDMRETVMGTEWQLTARPNCPSLPSLSLSFTHTRRQHKTCTEPDFSPGGLYG